MLYMCLYTEVLAKRWTVFTKTLNINKIHHCHYYERGGIAMLNMAALVKEVPPFSRKSQSLIDNY